MASSLGTEMRNIMSELTMKPLKSVQFGLLSADRIVQTSVCEVFSTKLSGPNSVYDERMGTLDLQKLCPQCHQKPKWCTGHFGHIRLSTPILHPLFYKHVLLFLRTFCFRCSRLLITEDVMRLHGMSRLPLQQRFVKVVEHVGKSSVLCPRCRAVQPRYCWNTADKTVWMNFKIDSETHRVPFHDHEILGMLDRIPDTDMPTLGYSAEGQFHPRNLVITMLPVLPPVARPYIMSDSVTCDDDLTVQYLEIVKTNTHLADLSLPEPKRTKFIQVLKFRIKSLFDNSSGTSKHSNGRPLKGIKKRLTGKEGLIRNNLMGKRVDKSARSVIGPDPTLRCDEIAVPPRIAQVLNYPVRVNAQNYDEVQRWIAQDETNFILKNNGDTRIHVRYAKFRRGTKLQIGDWVFHPHGGCTFVGSDEIKTFLLREGDVLIRNGKRVENLTFVSEKPVPLEIGDVVERPLKDGDILLLNRQPTLHKGSMIAQKVRLRVGKTIRMNLATTKTFNADFDGDEMNLHCPASVDAEAELRELSSLKNHLMSVQSSKPNITLVQDAMLAVFLLTKDDVWLTRSELWDLAMHSQLPQVEHVLSTKVKDAERVTGVQHCPDRVSGKFAFSLMLPRTFNFDYAGVVIVNGIMTAGTITKKHLGSSHDSILKLLHCEYSLEECMQFLDSVQFLANRFLVHRGFSVGISDCVVTQKEEIDNVISKALLKAYSVEQNIQDPLLKEAHIARTLSGARDMGMMIAKKALPPTNRFIATVTSGSKGDYFNIAQITGVIGQQFLDGQRIKPLLSGGRRTLPHYRPDGNESLNRRYESQGFVRHSFVHGMYPTEFFFHAMTGREGITDTAMKTATSGYIQRRMVKMAEDVQVKYDGTVRNSSDDIFQFLYGTDHCDTANSIHRASKDGMGTTSTFCKVDRLVQSLINEHP